MNRQENVGAGAVGDLGAFFERYERVGAPRLDDFDAGLPQQQLFEPERHVQRELGFGESLGLGAGVVAAVTGVDDDPRNPEPELP